MQPVLVTHKGPRTGLGRLAYGLHAALPKSRLLRLDRDAATVWEVEAYGERPLLRLPRGQNRFVFYRAALRQAASGPFHFTNQNLSHLAGPQDVVTCADLHHLGRGGFVRAVAARALYRGLWRARGVAAVSQFTRGEVAAWTGRSDVVVLPPAVSARRAHPARLGHPYILTVGSDTQRKNVPGLLSAFSDVTKRAEHRDLRLVKVGAAEQPADRARHLALATRLGLDKRVSWLDDVEPARLASLYAGASVVVLPSFYEGFGLPALEAMAQGAPVIASDRTALAETVGDAGLLVPPEPHALAAAIGSVLDDRALAAELRRRGLRRASQFTPTALAQRTRAWYKEFWP